MYFANLIKVKRRKGREESVAVKVKEYQFSKDPKSISLKQQHGVKASQTLHTQSYCHSATPAHLQSTRNSRDG